MIEAIERQIKPAVLAVMASVAALTGMGADRPAPQMIHRDSSPKITPAPDRPKLKFSNKLLTFPMPEIVFPENASPDHRSYRRAHRLQREVDFIREIAPYVPDIIYEKSKLPFAERIKFLNSPEKKKIMKAVQDRFGFTTGKTGSTRSFGEELLYECDSLLILGRPLISLWTETQSFREAVDLCGMTQLGKWMDVQKAMRREGKKIVPDGYDEAEGLRQKQYVNRFTMVFGDFAYSKAIGEMPEKPIRSDLIYFSAEDFAHLTPIQKQELLDLFALMPLRFKHIPGSTTGGIYALYSELRADKTGYRYMQIQNPRLSREEAAKVQKLAGEMVLYRRPLALLRAENYTLEQVIQVCQFRFAESFYGWRKKGSKKLGKTNEMGSTMISLQANALKTLGQKYNHPDWVQFGQEMYEMGQRFEVTRHDDSQMIDNRVAKAADAPRVREQDDSTNATSRVKRDADKGMK